MSFLPIAIATLGLLAPQDDADEHLVYEGAEGPGSGKHIVFVAGDEEYRSEEALPMLARILAKHHGFRCTVLFSTDPESGLIDPMNQTHIPGLEALADADLLFLFLRFRELPDEDMRHVVEYVERGGAVIGIRTATHAFAYKRDKESEYAHYSWRNDRWEGGFGRQILGETWVAHHGGHGSESTRGLIEKQNADHRILRGFDGVWGPSDVYRVGELPADARVLLRGQVLAGMEPDSAPVEGAKNEPMMPIVWTRELERADGDPMRVVCSTIGASQDMASAGLRRVLVNACYWCVGIEDEIPEKSVVDYVGDYEPTGFAHGGYTKGVRPRDLKLDDGE